MLIAMGLASMQPVLSFLPVVIGGDDARVAIEGIVRLKTKSCLIGILSGMNNELHMLVLTKCSLFLTLTNF